jgi:addiction module RelE/StbE family toxin
MNRIAYLPVAQQDIESIVHYIADRLKAPQAALEWLDALEEAISRLALYPLSCPVYQLVHPLDTEYRMLPVRNYLVFYVVLEDTVEIHRVLYSKRLFTREML